MANLSPRVVRTGGPDHPRSRGNKPQTRPVRTNAGVTAEPVVIKDYGGTVDGFRIIAYPFNERASLIDELLMDFTWSEDAESAAVSATFTVKNNGDFARTILKPGTWIFPQYLDPIQQRWVYLDPPMRVWSRGITDYDQREARITALDAVSLLQEQGEQNWLFRKDKISKKGWRADQIAAKILFDLEVEAKLYRTEYHIPYLYMQSHTPYEAILKAYTRDRQISQVRYRVRAEGKKIVALPWNKQDKVWEITEGSNLISSEWNESLEGFYTELIMLSTTNQLINRGARAISGNVQEYGRLRKIITFDRNVRQEVLKTVARLTLAQASRTKREVNIEAQGLLPLRATDAVYIRDSGAGLEGRFFVHSIRHNITPGSHTMSIKLSNTDIVPTLYPTREELVAAESDPNHVAQQGGKSTTETGRFAGVAVSAQVLNTYLASKNSPLRGYGASMVRLGQQHGVDPRMAAAVAGAETAFGLTGNAAGLHNAWGLGPGINYPSWEAGLSAFFRTLKSFTNLYTIADIQTKYAPSAAANDPTGLNNNWVRNVSKFYSEMGGNPTAQVNQLHVGGTTGGA